MASASEAKRIRWGDRQFVLGPDGMPQPRGTRALEDPVDQADRKRAKASMLQPEGPEIYQAKEAGHGFAASGDTELRGGVAALRR